MLEKSFTNMELSEKVMVLEKLNRDIREHIIAEFEKNIIIMVNDLHDRITKLEKKIYGVPDEEKADGKQV